MPNPNWMPAIVDNLVVFMRTTVYKHPPQADPGFQEGRVICPVCKQPIAANCDLIQHSTVDDPLMYTMFACLECCHSVTYIYRVSQIPRELSAAEMLEMIGKSPDPNEGV